MRSDLQGVRFSFGEKPTPVVRTLMWINGLTFLFILMVGQRALPLGAIGGEGVAVPYIRMIRSLLGLTPRAVAQEFTFWQPITYMFIHERFYHVAINMLMLWWFAPDVERSWGSRSFLRFYFFTGIGAALTCLAFQWNSPIPTIGASGAVFGILLAYGVLFPNRMIYLYLVFPIKAKYLVAASAVLTIVTLISGVDEGVSHLAHLGGMVFALLWIGFYRTGMSVPGMFRDWQRKRARRRFRLIRRNDDKDKKSSGGPYSKPTLH